MSDGSTAPLRVAFVPGVTPGKWERIWKDRMRRVRLELTLVAESDQVAVLHDGRADMSFVRLPVEREGLHLIPLYRERPVVVVPKEHPVTAYEEVTFADLAGEIVLDSPDLTVRQAVETVAAGTGVVLVPMSVARLHHRKDVEYRPVSDLPETQVGLAWRTDLDDDRVQTFIGIVRGRSANSTRR
ncbi:MAG: LysR family substrate-binding domain-containing protein [Nocardioidaceae bacterium]